jgi:hypothetical protein
LSILAFPKVRNSKVGNKKEKEKQGERKKEKAGWLKG